MVWWCVINGTWVRSYGGSFVMTFGIGVTRLSGSKKITWCLYGSWWLSRSCQIGGWGKWCTWWSRCERHRCWWEWRLGLILRSMYWRFLWCFYGGNRSCVFVVWGHLWWRFLYGFERSWSFLYNADGIFLWLVETWRFIYDIDRIVFYSVKS